MMKKYIIYTLGAIFGTILLILIVGIIKFNFSDSDTAFNKESVLKQDERASYDVKNVTIKIVTTNVTFKNGISELTDEGADANTVIKFFGEPVYNGQNEAYFYITQDSEGSGTFFYAAAAQKKDGKWQGTNAVFLGDRIAPQNINIIDGIANFNFADRIKGQPFSSPPRHGVTKRFSISDGMLKEVK